MGYDALGDNALNDAFDRFKRLADVKKTVFDEDIAALVDDEARDHARIRFVSLSVRSGSHEPARALLALSVDGTTREAEATGDGPVDATFNAIRTVFPHDGTLQLFSIGAVTPGTDAQARTTVRLEENGRMVDGQGADPDTIVASARAYVHALNKLLVKPRTPRAGGARDVGGVRRREGQGLCPWTPAKAAAFAIHQLRKGDYILRTTIPKSSGSGPE